MALKIDPKFVAVASIILGLFLGFYVNNTLLSRPKIEALTTQTEEHLAAIDGFEEELSTLQSDYETLDTLHTHLTENSVSLTEHEALQGEMDILEERLEEYMDQGGSMAEAIDTLEDQLDDLQNDYGDLNEAYGVLHDRFTEIYNPGYVFFSSHGLDINLTANQIWYESNTPIEGTVSIKHSNGLLFEGSFKLKITKVYVSVSAPSDYYEIHGEMDYSWPSPFLSGAGTYILSISEVLDDTGKIIADGIELREYNIKLYVG